MSQTMIHDAFRTRYWRRGIRYEEVSPFLLGRDLAGLIDEVESRSVTRFISLAMGQGDGGMTQAVMLQEAPIPSWREHPVEFNAAFKAFERGLTDR